MNKRVLITGSTGLIGRYIASVLDRKHDLHLASRSGQPIAQGPTIPFNLMQINAISEWLDSLAPEIIIHTAAITSADQAQVQPNDAEVLNVDATAMIADWCQKKGARLIYFSTDFVFDGSRRDVCESDAPKPLSWYGETKWRSEERIRSTLGNHVIIRPILVYGAAVNLSRLNFPLLIRSKLMSGTEMEITADQFRMPTYAMDIAKAVDRLTESEFTGTLHLAGPDWMSVYTFAETVADVFDLDKRLLKPVRTEALNFSARRPLLSGFDTSRAKKEVDWDPIGVNQALIQMKDIGQA
ncbi:MAG: SDR family oxidoreductase [Cryomorphaceae bacterium]